MRLVLCETPVISGLTVKHSVEPASKFLSGQGLQYDELVGLIIQALTRWHRSCADKLRTAPVLMH